jgi:hypothetical protein
VLKNCSFVIRRVISIIALTSEKISSSSPSGFYIHERLSIRERPRQELCIALTDHFFARGSSPVHTEEKKILTSIFFWSEERLGGPLRLCGRRSRIGSVGLPPSLKKGNFFLLFRRYSFVERLGPGGPSEELGLFKFVHAIRLVRLRCFLFHYIIIFIVDI